jgi:aspartate/methionine/tyrosine aminotransferase
MNLDPLYLTITGFAVMVAIVSILECNEYKRKMEQAESASEAMQKEMEGLVYAFNLSEKSRREAELQAADYQQQRDHLLQRLQEHEQISSNRQPGA